MKQSEFASIIDQAYEGLAGIGNKVSKEHKQMVYDAQKALRIAMEESGVSLPQPPSFPAMTEGSRIQKAIAVRKIKDIVDSLRKIGKNPRIEGGGYITLTDKFKDSIDDAIANLVVAGAIKEEKDEEEVLIKHE